MPLSVEQADAMHDKALSGSASDHRPPDGRAAPRTNLFLAATLDSVRGAEPVTIRDLSSGGARIQGARLLEIGLTATLARGPLRMPGEVSWSMGDRAGLRFASSISVRAWMANPLNREQQRIDRVIADVRKGTAIALPEARATEGADDLAHDLRRVADLLEQLGDELAGDAVVAANYAVKLQYLDIAAQTLTALAETVRTGDPEPASNVARLDDLRKSCTEALRAGQ
jgi:hypothetical protein